MKNRKQESLPALGKEDPGHTNSASGAEGATGPTFELTSLVSFVLFRLSSTLASLGERDAQEAAGLSLAEYRCLAALTTQGSMGVTGICQLTHIDKGWISRTLSKLGEAGLVVSTPDQTDSRRTVFTMTRQGRKVSEMLAALALKRQEKMLAGMSPGEVKQFRALLGRMQDNATKALIDVD